jgi:hypothetical protein
VTTTAPNDSTDLSGFNNFLLNAYLFSGGALNALSSNFFFGYMRRNDDASAYQAGQILGDAASVSTPILHVGACPRRR